MAACIAFGMVQMAAYLSAKIKNVRFSYLALVSISVGIMLINSVQQMAYTLAPFYVSANQVLIGNWIRERLKPDERFLQVSGGSSWATFIAQRIPIYLNVDQYTFFGPFAWPRGILSQVRSGDIVLMSPRPKQEFVVADIKVTDSPFSKTPGTIKVNGYKHGDLKLMRLSTNNWKIEGYRPGPYELGFVTFNNQIMFFPRKKVSIIIGQETLDQVQFIRLYEFDLKHFHMGPLVRFFS